MTRRSAHPTQTNGPVAVLRPDGRLRAQALIEPNCESHLHRIRARAAWSSRPCSPRHSRSRSSSAPRSLASSSASAIRAAVRTTRARPETDPSPSSDVEGGGVKRARRLPWHPLLLATAIVLTAWFDAAVSPYAAFRPLVVALLIAAALTGIGALVTRSWQLGGIAASVVIALLWSKQLIDAAGGIIGRAGPIIGLVWILLVAAVVALVAYLGRRRRWTRDGITSFLNRGAALLVVVAVGYGLISGRLPALVGDLRQGIPLDAWSGESDSPAGSPDMYAILLDGYPRADVLDYAFDIDNAAFTDALAERGFTVARRLAQRLPVDARQRPIGAEHRLRRADPGDDRRSSRVAHRASRRCARPSRQRGLRCRARARATTPWRWPPDSRRSRRARPMCTSTAGRSQRVRDQPAHLDVRRRHPECRGARLRIGAAPRARSQANLDALPEIAAERDRRAGARLRPRPGAAPADRVRRGRRARSSSR